jgi:hypothetical protein
LHSFDVNFAKNIFQKIQDGDWNEKISLSRHLGFFEKLCFQVIAKNVDTLRVLSKNLIWSAILDRTSIFDSFDKLGS